ncbi:arrestin domain-containing protein 3-like [Anopheles nili]|uniref:arrestin domain-containing protein 3-like n=1 Tax=Anopheles nili TaxID=185578 RepID=UPI00237B63A0|nr:arrestin domain-containing protein 3-like [Anopheles nili]
MAPSFDCTITFDNNSHGVFFAGQKLRGTVDFTLSKAKKVKVVVLKITGLARVQWTEMYGTGTTIQFSAKENFLTHTEELVRSDSDDPIELMPGRQIYKFTLQLPATLPTSFEGDYGYNRYTARVVLERPWKFDLTHKIAFTVVNQLNLNAISSPLNVAAVQEHVKHFNCGPCRSKPLTMNVMLPMTGFVPGQFILVTVNIDNGTKKRIADVKMKLRRQVEYRSATPYEQVKSVSCTLAKFQCSGVDAYGSAGYERRFLVPPEAPTRSDTIIRIEYYVEVIAKVPGMVYSPYVRIPVTIGTIPLLNLNQSQYRTSFVTAPLTAATGSDPKSFHISLQSLHIPHTFEKSAIRLDGTIPNGSISPSLSSSSFSPRYPVFRFESDKNLAAHGEPAGTHASQEQR